MAEMRVEVPVESKLVEDYDIDSVSGMSLTITIDPKAGDTIEKTDTELKIYLAPKKSINNPTKTLAAEEICVERRHIFAIRKRQREVLGLTPEQQVEWNKALDQDFSVKH